MPLFNAAAPLDRRLEAGAPRAALSIDERHVCPPGNAAIADALADWLAQERMAPPP